MDQTQQDKRSAPGPIILIGGAEDKTGDRAVLHHVWRRAAPGPIAVVPTASNYPKAVFDDYQKAFREMGVDRVEMVDVRSRREADADQWCRIIAEAGLVFFSGGDQEKLVDLLEGSRLIRTVRERHATGVAIAGTSAGASALGDPMILEGNGPKGLQRRHVAVRAGFGFLRRMVVDTHFMERGRIPRLAQIVSSRFADLGIGISEDTAVMFDGPDDGRFRVAGASVAAVLCSDVMTYSNYNHVDADAPVAFDGMRFSVLSAGMVYDMDQCRLAAPAPAETPA